jgi:1-deoxy-D-xylulose-5-phosphate synthase
MGELLSKINSPQDLKKLSFAELKKLAQEIREYLIKVVSKNGGHLAPNLGVVELTLGLHYALDSPRDKIIWDVGHQSYVHKIITGRKDKFPTLRKFGGIGGFPRREESEHDVFNTGHASNSISVALGLAEARDKRGGNEIIVAVIGDGALTGGIALEALNQAGHLKTNLIVILNDNSWSIAKNVGALSSYLARIRLDPTYNKLRDEFELALRKIPGIGEKLVSLGEKWKESVKHLFVPGMLFEELGFKYIGPIDGHNIERVATSISLAKRAKGPVLIHVLTKKGRGYKPAEECPDKFHGTSSFEVKTGKAKKKLKYPTYTQAFGEALLELVREREDIVAITAAMPSGTGLDIVASEYPDRVFDVGIAEQHAVTFSAGLALGGFTPVAAIYSTFLQRAFDQLIEDVALQNLHVVFALDRAGLVGEDGPTHHGAFDLSYLRLIPNFVVMAPKDENELRHMLFTAVNLEGPVAVRYPRGEGWCGRKEEFKEVPIGKAEVLMEGKDVCLFAIGRMVKIALEASEMLQSRGVKPTVVNARFLKPLDEKILSEIVHSHNLLVTLEENSLYGGFGSFVSEVCHKNKWQIPLLMFGLPDKFTPHGSIKELFAFLKIDAPSVVERIMEEVEEKGVSNNGQKLVEILSRFKLLRNKRR